jgi:hypothetical protein
VWVDKQIDTCFPSVIDSSISGQVDSRWPLISISDNRPKNDGKNWGINYIETLEILDVPAGREVEIDYLKTETMASPVAQFVSANHFARTQWYPPSSGSAPDRKRHALFLVDGRTGHELPDAQGSGAMAYVTIDEYVDEINALSGWAAIPNGFGHVYFNDTLPSQFVAGEGAMWTDDGYSTWTNKPFAGSLLTVKCQFLWDRLFVYPGIGDLFADEGYNDHGHYIDIRYHKFMRGAAHGLVGKLVPSAGKTVEIRRAIEGDLRGSDVSEANGFFQTELPYAYGFRNYKLFVNGAESGVGTLHTRKRSRFILQPQSQPRSVSYDFYPSGRHGRGFISDESSLNLGFARNSLPVPWVDDEPGVDTSMVSVNWNEQSNKNGLVVLTLESDVIRIRSTDDEGRVVASMVDVVAGAEIGDFIVPRSGRIFVYYVLEGSSTVQCKVYEPTFALIDEFTTNVVDIDPSKGLSVGDSVGSKGDWRVGILYINVAGTLTFKIANKRGDTFS